jgi:hypothetical protein
VAKTGVEVRGLGSVKKAKAPVRASSKVAPKKAASRKLTGRSVPTVVKKKPSAKPSKPRLTTALAPVERAATVSKEAKPHVFWNPHGRQSDVTGDTKAHTKPEDQRADIRMKAPRTWSNRQPGRG